MSNPVQRRFEMIARKTLLIGASEFVIPSTLEIRHFSLNSVIDVTT
jgi:hypothetical protein